MRIALLATSLVTLLLVGYQIRRDRPTEPPPATAVSAAPASDLVAGDRVVGRWQTGFYEGTVIEAEGKLVVVAWDSGSPDHSHLPRGWFTRADAYVTEPSAGRWYVAHLDGQWQLVRATASGFELLDGTTRGADGRALVVRLPAGLTAWAEHYGAETIAFAKQQAALAKLAPVTAGKAVVAGDEVLARWTDGNWWRARVTRSTGDEVVVAWHDGSGPMTLPAADVAPLRTGGALEPGAFAICDWQSGTRWYRALIDDARDGGYRVEYIDGTESDVGRDDCVAAAAR